MVNLNDDCFCIGDKRDDIARSISSNSVSGTPWRFVWTGDSEVFLNNQSTRSSVRERPAEKTAANAAATDNLNLQEKETSKEPPKIIVTALVTQRKAAEQRAEIPLQQRAQQFGDLLREKELKTQFLAMLKENGTVRKSSKWSEMKKTLDADPRYKQVESSSQKENWFKEYQKTLTNENLGDEEEEARKDRLKDKDQFDHEKAAQKARELEVFVQHPSIDSAEEERSKRKTTMIDTKDGFRQVMGFLTIIWRQSMTRKLTNLLAFMALSCVQLFVVKRVKNVLLYVFALISLPVVYGIPAALQTSGSKDGNGDSFAKHEFDLYVGLIVITYGVLLEFFLLGIFYTIKSVCSQKVRNARGSTSTV